jgi:Ca2+-binding RTX toxin-like protein
MSKYIRPGGALLAGMTALVLAALPATAPAQTQQVAFARSTATGGMSYTSTDAATTIRVSLANNKFTIDDDVPIQAQEGCAAVTGDATKVTCTAFKDTPSVFKRFTVSALGGADSVQNNTTKTNGVGAPMLAGGGNGNDTLVGADKVADDLHGDNDQDVISAGNDTIGSARDRLRGSSGSDHLIGGNRADELLGGDGDDTLDGGDGGDLLNGGSGADLIDGGQADTFGATGHDLVSYASSSQPVVVDLNLASPQVENDKILRVEDIEGSRLNDVLIGDGKSNRLFGIEGNDTLLGNNGIDTLIGGDGADELAPSPEGFFGVLPDGKPDSMDCGNIAFNDGDPGDFAFRVLADGDTVTSCPTVFDN